MKLKLNENLFTEENNKEITESELLELTGFDTMEELTDFLWDHVTTGQKPSEFKDFMNDFYLSSSPDIDIDSKTMENSESNISSLVDYILSDDYFITAIKKAFKEAAMEEDAYETIENNYSNGVEDILRRYLPGIVKDSNKIMDYDFGDIERDNEKDLR